MAQKRLVPDALFEVSWEVCNKVGGIHTVVSTKVQSLADSYTGLYVAIGPDILREGGVNPEFVEEHTPLSDWAAQAAQEGVRVRVGRWAIPGEPLAMLVDFSSYIAQKDAIFGRLWETYQLDSLEGQWDYIEPALFGYAAGRAIESLIIHRLSMRHRITAQFHEWMTGVGLLYLRKAMPQVGSVFTSHATVLGRSLAGNGVPLYSQLPSINPEAKAREFHVVPKQSLERIAAQHSDVFTTVSELTAAECQQFLGRRVDLLTPNGFEPNFVPEGEEYHLQRVEAKLQLLTVAQAVLGHPVPVDSLIVGTSGRYEFKNKGLDVFIDALAELNNNPEPDRKVLAFMLIPAGHKGPCPLVLDWLRQSGEPSPAGDSCGGHLTHALTDPERDPILQRLREKGLSNHVNDRVQVVYVPCYLDGRDGVFNRTYYELLIGMDLTVFASYYEPWGYTPLESVAFHVPTVTTTLAGFGLWVQKRTEELPGGVHVLPRNDENTQEVVQGIARTLRSVALQNAQQAEEAARHAQQLSECAVWSRLVDNYKDAYSQAIAKALGRTEEYTQIADTVPEIDEDLRAPVPLPSWNRILVQKNIPAPLKALDSLAHNLWWCWHQEARELFASIAPLRWRECEENPVMLLDTISYKRLEELSENTEFVHRLAEVKAQFDTYMATPKEKATPAIGYFSMEYGLHASLKLYSGGLGVLAGDYLKEASDRNVNLAAIGLFYRYGYFTQRLSIGGQQIAQYNHQNFTQTPAQPVRDAEGNWLTVEVAFPGRVVRIRVWVVMVGRIPLYLLDTDFEGNTEEDRTITHYLYGGDRENRFKQEMILGIGGLRALMATGFKPDILHLNEGHAAFAALERLRQLMLGQNYTFDEAVELLRAQSVFTTHTPVPAGHDRFPEDLMRTYMAHYPPRYRISWERFMSFGRIDPHNPKEEFSMSNLAAQFSQGVNGVSQLHGEVSQRMFAALWPGYFANENHVGYVTNGVHFPTWIAQPWRELLCRGAQPDALPSWEHLNDAPDAEIWAIRQRLRQQLVDSVVEELTSPSMAFFQSPKHTLEVKEKLRPDVLTIGFARRFATYKRAHLLLSDLERLASIVNSPERPVQLLFAGKAHPNDTPGQELIKRIFEVSMLPEFRGKLLFLPNYDMALAQKMVQGVDVWLNTPTRPQEASGTSGMKAVMNGSLHFSVLDGWWVEGYEPKAGWAIAQMRTYQNQTIQDELDAEVIYSTIESEIAPMFYSRNAQDIPEEWVAYIRRSMTSIAPRFTSTRMQQDYYERYYAPQGARYHRLLNNDAQELKTLMAWKKKLLRHWNSIAVIRVEGLSMGNLTVETGREYSSTVVLDLPDLSPDDVGVELVQTILRPGDDSVQVHSVVPYQFVRKEGTRAVYRAVMRPEEPGAFDVAVRLYAKSPLLPSRMDFCLMRWV